MSYEISILRCFNTNSIHRLLNLSYLICILGDTTPSPFDLVESESEQVVELYIEYPTVYFSLFYMMYWYKYDNQLESSRWKYQAYTYPWIKITLGYQKSVFSQQIKSSLFRPNMQPFGSEIIFSKKKKSTFLDPKRQKAAPKTIFWYKKWDFFSHQTIDDFFWKKNVPIQNLMILLIKKWRIL